MTRLFNEPAAFADEMIEGFVASHGRWVKRVSGGVVRSTQEHPGHGGAGDRRRLRPLPGVRRAGGPGPGARRRDGQPLRVPLGAAGLQRGQGRQQRRRRAAGLRQLRRRRPALHPGPGPPPQGGHRLPQHRRHRRRLLRPAGRARQAPRHRRGPDRLQGGRRRRRGRLRHGRHRWKSPSAPTTAPAPSASRSPAAPFPGADHPLFSVPEGRMAVGMGIHGEPGIDETDIPTADELAELLVAKLLTEIPEGLEVQTAPRAWSRSSTAWAASSTRSSSWSTAASPSSWPKPAWKPWTRRWANSSPASTWPAPP